MKYIVDDPNFSVIMPGGCNASCDFCFYEYSKDTELLFSMWKAKLDNVLNKLPKQFKQVSITGGEPTLNPGNLYSTVIALRKRFDKIVLTTNGYDLRIVRALVEDGLIDYINISRHSYCNKVNESIFESSYIPSARELREFIKYSHINGVPVTVNCVVTGKLKNIHSMVDFCRDDLKSYAVRFRLQSKEEPVYDLSPSDSWFEEKPIYKEGSGDV